MYTTQYHTKPCLQIIASPKRVGVTHPCLPAMRSSPRPISHALYDPPTTHSYTHHPLSDPPTTHFNTHAMHLHLPCNSSGCSCGFWSFISSTFAVFPPPWHHSTLLHMFECLSAALWCRLIRPRVIKPWHGPDCRIRKVHRILCRKK